MIRSWERPVLQQKLFFWLTILCDNYLLPRVAAILTSRVTPGIKCNRDQMRWEAYKSVEVNDQIAWDRFSSSMLTGSQVAKPRESNYIVGLYCDWPILISCTGKFNTRSYYIGIYFAVLLALALHRHVEPCQQDKEKFLSRCDIQFLSKRQRECSLT